MFYNPVIFLFEGRKQSEPGSRRVRALFVLGIFVGTTDEHV